jgi:hypothetical protein
MSSISEIGNRLLAMRGDLKLKGPQNYRPGWSKENLMTKTELAKYPWSELHELYCWRDGVSSAGGTLGELWITPGFYFLSLDEAAKEAEYLSKFVDNWNDSWFPILSDSSAERRFVDLNSKESHTRSVFIYDPFDSPVVNRIYDTIESMLRTFLSCYDQQIYSLTTSGRLVSDFVREVALARDLNPNSDYWTRGDLV